MGRQEITGRRSSYDTLVHSHPRRSPFLISFATAASERTSSGGGGTRDFGTFIPHFLPSAVLLALFAVT